VPELRANRLVVLDPGYGHRNAHHHMVNVQLANDLATADVALLVVSSAELTADSVAEAASLGLSALPWFTIPRYPDHAETLPVHEYERLAAAFADQIVALFDKGIVQAEDPVLLHTGFAFHFHGLALALWKLKGRVSGRWVGLTMFAPGTELVPGSNERYALEDGRITLRYRLALKLLHSVANRAGVDLVLASPTRAFQRTYQQFWPGKVALHPAVNFRLLCNSAVAKSDKRFTVLLYLGCPKRDKGIEFALQVGMAAAAKFSNIQLVFHFNSEFHGANRFDEQVAALRYAGKQYANVTVLTGNLSSLEYDALLQGSDMVCLLYDPSHYRMKTSGIFWDVLRSDQVAWLVTEDSWMNGELMELGVVHETVKFGDVTGALRCIDLKRHRPTVPILEFSNEALQYRRQICRPLAGWLLEVFGWR